MAGSVLWPLTTLVAAHLRETNSSSLTEMVYRPSTYIRRHRLSYCIESQFHEHGNCWNSSFGCWCITNGHRHSHSSGEREMLGYLETLFRNGD